MMVFIVISVIRILNKENSRCKESVEKENGRSREQIGTEACIVGSDEMCWTHDQNERREFTEKSTMRLQKTRTTTGKRK